jgi:hypothetical protein
LHIGIWGELGDIVILKMKILRVRACAREGNALFDVYKALFFAVLLALSFVGAVLAVGVSASSLAFCTFLAVSTATGFLLGILLAAVSFLFSVLLAAVSFLLSILFAAVFLFSLFLVAAFFLSLLALV